MWKALWKKWTIDKPVIVGDRLWDVFVAQFAAFLDRLTLRKTIAFIPVVILVLAYYHRIPIPPELMLVGDLLAYIDIFAVVFLLGMLGRVATILFVIRQVAARAGSLAAHLMTAVRRLDFRHSRQRAGGRRKRLSGRPGKDDDGPSFASGMAWA